MTAITLKDILAAIAVVINCLPMAMLALSYGFAAFPTALIVYIATSDLIWTIVISVVVSTIAYLIRRGKDTTPVVAVDESQEHFKPIKLEVNSHIVRSVLAVCTLQIGGNISYATITAGLAGGKANVDLITIYSGIADSVSAFFGGGPVEAIISGTAAAPHPLIAGLFVVFPPDAMNAMQDDPLVGSCVIIVTSFSDPFVGMVAGIALKYGIQLFGMI